MNGMLFDIERDSLVDGPGIRTTVFFKGCNLRCAWCHNPESQQGEPELLYYRDKCTGCGKCAEVCPHHLESCELCGKCTWYCPADARELCGRRYEADEVLSVLLRDTDYYASTGGGVTFSGGECMLQIDFLEELLVRCREQGVHTAVDTAGHVPFERFERVMPHTALFLYDVKCMDSERHRACTGVGNELILENLARLLERGEVPVWVRIPVVPGVNDSEENLQAVRAFYEAHGWPEKTELLPYHALGENKYLAEGREPVTFEVPDKERIQALARIVTRE